MWVIHQAPDPTVTFTKETGTISGATYSGSDKTITAEPGADIGLATGVYDVDFLYVIQPTYLDVSNLSDNVKNIAFLKLQRMQDNWLYKNQIYHYKLYRTLKYLLLNIPFCF